MEHSAATRDVVIAWRKINGGGIDSLIADDITVEEFVEVVVAVSAVLYDHGAKPMEILFAFQRAAAAMRQPEADAEAEADEVQPAEEWQPPDPEAA